MATLESEVPDRVNGDGGEASVSVLWPALFGAAETKTGVREDFSLILCFRAPTFLLGSSGDPPSAAKTGVREDFSLILYFRTPTFLLGSSGDPPSGTATFLER